MWLPFFVLHYDKHTVLPWMRSNIGILMSYRPKERKLVHYLTSSSCRALDVLLIVAAKLPHIVLKLRW